MKTNILKKFMNILGDETKLYFSADEPVSIWLYIKKKSYLCIVSKPFHGSRWHSFFVCFFLFFFKKIWILFLTNAIKNTLFYQKVWNVGPGLRRSWCCMMMWRMWECVIVLSIQSKQLWSELELYLLDSGIQCSYNPIE